MNTDLHRLLPLFERERARGATVALAVLASSAGSTYRKPGAMMLIARGGEYAGLLSGGCLEGDLRVHAERVIDSGEPALVSYDMRNPDDLLWGLGSGCEGAMDIALFAVGPRNGWEPVASFARSLAADLPSSCALLTRSADTPLAAGSSLLLAGDTVPRELRTLMMSACVTGRADRFVLAATPDHGQLEGVIVPLILPARLAILGAGPDARPLAHLAAFMGWRTTVIDHRASYADPSLFPQDACVLHLAPEEAAVHLRTTDFDAAVVMSHHLATDLIYLRALATTTIGYVGLLGPAARRERLVLDLGADAAPLAERLRAPVGLDIGAQTPEAIALAIAAQLQAELSGKGGGIMPSAAKLASRLERIGQGSGSASELPLYGS